MQIKNKIKQLNDIRIMRAKINKFIKYMSNLG